MLFKRFKVDLAYIRSERNQIRFQTTGMAIWSVDADNVYWLFSNGTLYSYDPQMIFLIRSLYMQTGRKRMHIVYELIKGFDYPTVLHKNSSTFWINFIPDKELYKINLKNKKIEKIFKCCMDQRDCEIPGDVFDMYSFDSTRIYISAKFFWNAD